MHINMTKMKMRKRFKLAIIIYGSLCFDPPDSYNIKNSINGCKTIGPNHHTGIKNKWNVISLHILESSLQNKNSSTFSCNGLNIAKYINMVKGSVPFYPILGYFNREIPLFVFYHGVYMDGS